MREILTRRILLLWQKTARYYCLSSIVIIDVVCIMFINNNVLHFLHVIKNLVLSFTFYLFFIKPLCPKCVPQRNFQMAKSKVLRFIFRFLWLRTIRPVVGGFRKGSVFLNIVLNPGPEHVRNNVNHVRKRRRGFFFIFLVLRLLRRLRNTRSWNCFYIYIQSVRS